MSFPPVPLQVALATKSNAGACLKNVPLLFKALDAQNVRDPRAIAGALATVGVECHFVPQCEKGKLSYFQKYENDKELGNNQPGDGYKFRGRGYQLTGRLNYTTYGKLLGLDLINNPDLANDPVVAAEIFALFFVKHGMDVHSVRGNWRKVRKIYNGGLNDFVDFQTYAYALLDYFYSS